MYVEKESEIATGSLHHLSVEEESLPMAVTRRRRALSQRADAGQMEALLPAVML